MYKSQKFSIESAEGKTSFEQSSQLLHSQIWDSCSGALKLKPNRISIEGHNSQTQTDNQLRSISGQTVRDRTESVEIISLSEDQAEKIRYVEAKSDQYERSCACLKFNSILSRVTLARFVRTLPARSSAPSDPILFPHILFFSSGADLNKSFSELFTQNFFWPFPPSFSKNGKKSEIGNQAVWELPRLCRVTQSDLAAVQDWGLRALFSWDSCW